MTTEESGKDMAKQRDAGARKPGGPEARTEPGGGKGNKDVAVPQHETRGRDE